MTNFEHPNYRLDGQRVDASTVAEIAEGAIRARLGIHYVAEYGTAGCLRNVQPQEDTAAAVHLNSGGNALAVESALQREGYAVSPGPRPEYGVVLIVTHAGTTRPQVGP